MRVGRPDLAVRLNDIPCAASAANKATQKIIDSVVRIRLPLSLPDRHLFKDRVLRPEPMSVSLELAELSTDRRD
jgi:hypothetical protein